MTTNCLIERMTNESKVKVYRKPREYLEKYPDGLMVICSSIPGTKFNGKYYGDEFLLRYSAWGFVNLARDPDYFGLYISHPISAVRYFGVIDEIIDPRKDEHLVEDFRDYEPYESGDKLIMLKSDSIVELDDEIPFEGDPNQIWGFRYTTLDNLIDAETTEELWS